MARKDRGGSKQSQNGVSGDGGSGESNGAGPASGEPGGGGGSGDGGGNGDGGSVIEPKLGDGHGTDNGDGGAGGSEPRRGRGRPAGSRTQKKAEISVTTLAEVIAFAHVGIATVLKNDAWALDDGESKRLADAAAKVLRHHDTPAFSAYAMDWIGLLMVAGNVYGPRVAVAFASQTTTPARPTTATARTPQQPKEPVTEQEDGTVLISHPDGSGRMVRMPVQN